MEHESTKLATVQLAGAGDYTFASMTSSGGISKTGTGTVTMNGNATSSSIQYTGLTTVSAGTLLINGSLVTSTNAVTVSGGTLGGTGAILRPTTFNGGILSPGAAGAVGLLSFGNTTATPTTSLTLNTGSTTALQLNGTSRGTTYDGLDFTAGNVSIGGTLALNFGSTFNNGDVLDLFSLTGTSTLTAGRSFDFVTGAGSYTGSFTNNSGIWSLTNGDTTLSFNQTTGDLTVVSIIPEPATCAALAAVGVMGLAVWRRTRRAADVARS